MQRSLADEAQDLLGDLDTDGKLVVASVRFEATCGQIGHVVLEKSAHERIEHLSWRAPPSWPELHVLEVPSEVPVFDAIRRAHRQHEVGVDSPAAGSAQLEHCFAQLDDLAGHRTSIATSLVVEAGGAGRRNVT